HGDRVVALLLSTLWGLIAFRGHEFIEHGVVLLELLVQPLIVGFLADVNDGDQIDFDTFLTAGRDVLGDHGLQGDGLPVFVPLHADEAGFGIGACSRECWYEACQYQQRLEDETHSLPPLNGPADSQRRLRWNLRRCSKHSTISAISSSRGRVVGQWIGSSHILGSAFLPKVSRYIPVHVESLRRPTADDVFAGEQVDGNDGAHGGALTQVFSIGWAALHAA